jgi:hypothetical protein
MTAADPPTSGTSADHSRSGADITEAIEVAEQGSSVREVHDQPEETTSGEAPVEQVAGDPAMTESEVAGDSEGGGSDAAPESDSSGAAQSVRGARPIDQP